MPRDLPPGALVALLRLALMTRGGPLRACDAHPPSHPRIDHSAVECKKLSASEAPDPGRHHIGTPGDIISECPGDFVGIRTGVPIDQQKPGAHGSVWLASHSRRRDSESGIFGGNKGTARYRSS